jgi:hypothetical protein
MFGRGFESHQLHSYPLQVIMEVLTGTSMILNFLPNQSHQTLLKGIIRGLSF